MKTIATLILALAATVAGAIERPKLEVIPLTADRAVIALTTENPAKFEVTIKSKDGRVVYYKQTVQDVDNYRKVYDFSGLDKGRYELAFKVNNTMVKREIEILKSSIQVGAAEMRFDPFFKLDGDVLKLSFLNFDQKNVTFTLVRDSEEVFRTSLGKSFNQLRGFDLSKLEKGKYDVILADGSNDYFYSIER